jgi:hypothetical protein
MIFLDGRSKRCLQSYDLGYIVDRWHAEILKSIEVAGSTAPYEKEDIFQCTEVCLRLRSS